MVISADLRGFYSKRGISLRRKIPVVHPSCEGCYADWAFVIETATVD